MASHPHAPVVTIDASLGAALIGVLLMCTLLGIVITQTHTYFRTFGNDPTWLKTVVGLVFVLEVGQSICVAHVLYLFAVTGYGDPTAMANPPKTFGSDIVLTLMLKFIVETYFAYRIWRLTSNKIVAGIAVILNIVAITFGIVIATNSFILKSLPEYRARMSWVIPTSFAVSLAVDVYITVSLISWLARRRRVALRSTVKILDRALLWAIQTGFVTSLNSVILLITFELMPANFVWIAFYIIQPKLYSNSLLASLNARASNNRQHDSSIDIEASGGSMIAGSYQSTTRAATAHTKDLELHKQKGNETVRFAHSVPSIIEIRPQAKEGKQDVKGIDLGYHV